ncbi:MAG: hypothetical protein ACRDA5_16100 [Clostridium sp.]
MNSYIFLTEEGYTYQPNSECQIPDIENLQVIGISKGENESEAFYNLMEKREYLMETTFDEIFCYKLGDDYKNSYNEFSIKTEYNSKRYNHDETRFILKKIREGMDTDIVTSHRIYNAIFDISRENYSIASSIIKNEYYCNYYIDINNYEQLHISLWNDEGLWEDKKQHKDLYDFLSQEHDENDLEKILKKYGWFISRGFAICLDNEIIEKIDTMV